MQKMVIESWARQGMSREAFIDYLGSVHGPLVKQYGPALGFRKYIQNHRLPSPEIDGFVRARGWQDASDSSVELWLDDDAGMSPEPASAAAVEASAILEVDERKFVDPSRISAFMAREHVIFDYTAPGARFAPGSRLVKMVVQGWKRDGMSDRAFQERWRGQHAEVVQSVASAMGVVRYVQSHPTPAPWVDAFAAARGWRQPPDGLAELWWESQDAMAKIFATPECAEASAVLERDEKEFINPTKLTAFLAREHVVFDATQSV